MSRVRTNLLRRKNSTKKSVDILGVKVGGILDKSLEKEILRIEAEKIKIAHTCFSRLRRRGRILFHGQRFLLAIVILSALDCSFIMAGLILELTVVNDLGENVVALSEPHASYDCDGQHGGTKVTHHHIVLVTTAHTFTYASLATVSLLLLQMFVKVICFWKRMLTFPFEMYDAVVVVTSFLADVTLFHRSTSEWILENARVISSFIIPFKILRVVNSIIIALYDEEHNKLLLMFKSKRYLQKQTVQLMKSCDTVENTLLAMNQMAKEEGVPDWRIHKAIGDVCMQTQTSKKFNAVKTLVSMAVGNAVQYHIAFLNNFNHIDKSEDSLMHRTKRDRVPFSDCRRWSDIEQESIDEYETDKKRNHTDSMLSKLKINDHQTHSPGSMPDNNREHSCPSVVSGAVCYSVHSERPLIFKTIPENILYKS